MQARETVLRIPSILDRVSRLSAAAVYESDYRGIRPTVLCWSHSENTAKAGGFHSPIVGQAEIYDRLVNGAALKGTSMCVLICAILIASIGLNMNSTAVIIGAMLISPLMRSIIAAAYGGASGALSISRHDFIGFRSQSCGGACGDHGAARQADERTAGGDNASVAAKAQPADR